MERTNSRLIFGAIVMLAFLLRMIYVWQLRGSPLFDAPILDALYHDQWARAIVAGREFVTGPYFRAPLYPHFLAAVYKLFGEGYLAPRIVQSFLGSVSCGLVFLIGLRTCGRTVGILAGVAAATYWVLIYFDAELLIPSVIVFLDLLLILQLLHAAARPSPLCWGLAGVILGLSAIARPNILLFAPAVVAWLAWLQRPRWRRAAILAACFVVGCLLPILPVTVRNMTVGGDIVLIAAQDGVNFYIGNNPDSDGSTAIVPGTPGDWWGGYRASIARAEKARGRPLKPSEVSWYYYGEALAFLRSQPGEAVALFGRKLWLFWNGEEISNNKDLRFWTDRFTPVVKFLPLSFAVVGPLGILGMFLGWRRRVELFPLWGFVLVYMLSVVLFFCSARYRCPVLGPLLVLSSFAVVHLIGVTRRRQWRRLLRCAAVLLPAAVLVNAVPGVSDPTGGAQSLGILARAHFEKGQMELALAAGREAVRADPANLSARYDLGTLLLQAGQPGQAIEQFQTALGLTSRLRPGETMITVADIHHNLGNALYRAGNPEAALPHYRRAIQLHPDGGIALYHFNLGNALLQLDEPDSAVLALERAVALDPGLPRGYHELAWGLIGMGEWSRAAVAFRKAVQLAPADPAAWHGLGQALLNTGSVGEAIEALQRARRLVPGNIQVIQDHANALIDAGRYREALGAFEAGLAETNGQAGDSRAVERQDVPQHEDQEDLRNTLRNNLAWLLATCPDPDLRNGRRAVMLAEGLCPDLETCDPRRLDTLAAALAEAGQYTRAAVTGRLAEQRARQLGDAELTRVIADRVALFESGQPYHEPRIGGQ